MTSSQNPWGELSERLDALAYKLKLHLDQASDGDMSEALARLGQRVQEAFDAVGNAAHDDAVRADVREAGRLLADAVSSALGKVKDEVREAMARRP